jgi:hypothetical protein
VIKASYKAGAGHSVPEGAGHLSFSRKNKIECVLRCRIASYMLEKIQIDFPHQRKLEPSIDFVLILVHLTNVRLSH